MCVLRCVCGLAWPQSAFPSPYLLCHGLPILPCPALSCASLLTAHCSLRTVHCCLLVHRRSGPLGCLSTAWAGSLTLATSS